MFGRLIVFFGRYSASRKFLGRLRPAFFLADFRLISAYFATKPRYGKFSVKNQIFVTMATGSVWAKFDWHSLKGHPRKPYHKEPKITTLSFIQPQGRIYSKPGPVQKKCGGPRASSHISWSHKIRFFVSRGHLRAIQIWRCFLCKDIDILLKAFTTYVRPLLEYCSPVWSPVCYSC